MLLRAYASFWHWTQRPDATPQNFSVGYWLLSRVHALLGHADQSRDFGGRALEQAAGESPFYLGYAHEALARAAQVKGDEARFRHHVSEAEACMMRVADQENRSLLENDLAWLRSARFASDSKTKPPFSTKNPGI